MKFSQTSRIKFILILAVATLICWAATANAAEKWDAKASARVNLRKSPSSKGIILSIVPRGYNVRILEKKGFWRKVEVEGEIHGKGWVYGKYLEEILPEVSSTASALPAVGGEIAAGQQAQGVPPAKPAPKAQMAGDRENLLNIPSPASVSRVDATVQSSAHPEFRDRTNEFRALSPVEISAAKEPAYTTLPQAPPQVRKRAEKQEPLPAPPPEKPSRAGVTAQPSIRNEFLTGNDESIAVVKRNVPPVGKPDHILTIQAPPSGIESDTLVAIEKPFSEVLIQKDLIPHVENFPAKKKEPDTTGQRKLLGATARTVSSSPAVTEIVRPRLAVSHGRKGPIHRQKSIGLVELTLKLLTIALSCLVILFLHRANKIAAHHYDALMQLQQSLETR